MGQLRFYRTRVLSIIFFLSSSSTSPTAILSPLICRFVALSSFGVAPSREGQPRYCSRSLDCFLFERLSPSCRALAGSRREEHPPPPHKAIRLLVDSIFEAIGRNSGLPIGRNPFELFPVPLVENPLE